MRAGRSITSKLDDPDNAGSFTGELARAIERHDPRLVSVVEAGEWRVREDMEQWADKFACEIEILRDDRFICTQAEFDDWADGPQGTADGVLLSRDAAQDRPADGG